MNGTKNRFGFIGKTRVSDQFVFEEKREGCIIVKTYNCNIVPAVESFPNIAFLPTNFLEVMLAIFSMCSN